MAAGDPRLGHALWWLGQRDYATAAGCMAALKRLCAQTGDGGPPICLRAEEGGTVSSSIVVLRLPPSPGLYLHAQGPPDAVAYTDYSGLLREL